MPRCHGVTNIYKHADDSSGNWRVDHARSSRGCSSGRGSSRRRCAWPRRCRTRRGCRHSRWAASLCRQIHGICSAIHRDVHWRGGCFTNLNIVLNTIDCQLESLRHLDTLDGRSIDRLRPSESQLEAGAFAPPICGSDAVDRPLDSAMPRAITATSLPVRPAAGTASTADDPAVSNASMADGDGIVLLPVTRSRKRRTLTELSAPLINSATIISAVSTTKTTPIPTPVTIRASMRVSESDVVVSP